MNRVVIGVAILITASSYSQKTKFKQEKDPSQRLTKDIKYFKKAIDTIEEDSLIVRYEALLDTVRVVRKRWRKKESEKRMRKMNFKSYEDPNPFRQTRNGKQN